MPASLRFGEAKNGVIALPRALFLLRIDNLVDEIDQQAHIAPLPEQDAIRRLPITPGAPRLLVILLDRFGKREVDYGAHGSLVDAEAKSDGAHQHARFIGHPLFLISLSRFRIHLAVIRDGANAFVPEKVN